MMNKKLIALFVAIATVGAISAHYCDYHNCDRPGVVRGTVGVADDIADTTVGRGSILNPGNWGERGRERRREAREDRRDRRYYRD